MADTTLSDLHQTLVESLFKEILKNLDLAEESPRIFLVYAHPNDTLSKKADAKDAHQLIQWLGDLGANIYSDRTARGNNIYSDQISSETAS